MFILREYLINITTKLQINYIIIKTCLRFYLYLCPSIVRLERRLEAKNII